MTVAWPGDGLDDQLVAGLLNSSAQRRHVGIAAGADGYLASVEVDVDTVNSGNLGHLGPHCAHAVAARHAIDRIYAFLHADMVAPVPAGARR